MKQEQLHAGEKVVQQMSRQGLVEENLAQETVSNISQKQEDYSYSNEQTEQAHDSGQNKSYYEPAPNEMPGNAPVLPAEFASLTNRIPRAADRNEDNRIADETAAPEERLLESRNENQQKKGNRKKQEDVSHSLSQEKEERQDAGEKDEKEPEEEDELKNPKTKATSKNRLQEDKEQKLCFEKKEKKEEKKAFEEKKVPKHLLFEKEEEKNAEKDGKEEEEKYAISHILKRKNTGTEEDEEEPEEKRAEKGTRLRFREEKKTPLNNPANRSILGRSLSRRFEEEQESELDFGAQNARQMARESVRLLETQKREERRKQLNQEKKKSAVNQEQPSKLKNGSRYFKEEGKENSKKQYQRKINQQKSIEYAEQTVKNAESAVKKKKAVQKAAAVAKTGIFILLGFVLLLIVLLFGLGYILSYVFQMGGAGVGTIYSGLYQSTYSDISDCEAYFRELETDLEDKIAHIEEEEKYKDCFEFVYELGDIGHQAVELISYLSVKYTDFTLKLCTLELNSLFKERYTLTVEVKKELRERQQTDEAGNGIYDENGDPVNETFMADICYVTLTVKPWDEIINGHLTTDAEKSRYKVYVMSRGAQQVYRNPLAVNWENKISSRFGCRIHPITKKKTFHSGIDIAVPVGTPLYSSTDGIVTIAGYSETAGNYIVVVMESGYSIKYMHLDSLGVHPGDSVSKGMPIGETGNTGKSTGPHLHVEVRTPEPEYKAIDPTFIISNGAAPEEGE